MLARWNPWQDLFSLQREMDDTVRRAFSGNLAPFFVGERQDRWTPAVDVFSRQGDLVIRAELPGVDPEKDLDISVQDGVLTLSGERRHEARTNGEDSYFRVESSFGSFQRRVSLPEGVQADDIRATYEQGILEVVVPKAAELSAPKRVPITVGGRRTALTTKGRKK